MTTTTATTEPTIDQVLTGMSSSLNGTLPPSVQLASTVMPDMVLDTPKTADSPCPRTAAR